MVGKPVVTNRSVVTLHVGDLLGCPGWMNSIWIPRFAAHAKITALMYSGPLSHPMGAGLPRIP